MDVGRYENLPRLWESLQEYPSFIIHIGWFIFFFPVSGAQVVVHFLKNHFKIHFQTTPAAGLMDWEFPVGGTSTINVFSIQKNNYSVASESSFCGNHCKPQRSRWGAGGNPQCDHWHTFKTTFSGFFSAFIAHFALKWEDLAGSGGVRTSGGLHIPRGFISELCVIFPLWKLPGAILSAARAGNSTEKHKYFIFLLDGGQCWALWGSGCWDEVSPPDPRFLGSRMKQILTETNDPKMI